MGVRGDLQMLETAIRRRFPVDTAKAAETVNRHLADADPRAALRAASIAAMMESLNQKDEHKVIDVQFEQRNAQLDAIAADLGIEASLIAYAEGQSGSSNSGTEKHADGVN